MKIVEKKNNSLFIIILCCLELSLFGNCIQERRLGIYRQQSEYYRTEFEAASNREQQLAATIDECWRSTERTGEILSQSINSVAELRKQMHQVRENYEAMENMLLGSYDRLHNNDNNID